MRTAVNAAIINSGRLLVVKKREVWILPGGKPEEGEKDSGCLEREVMEELSGTKIKIQRFYSTFRGKTPHKGDILEARVYFCSLNGELKSPSAEIDDVTWINYNESQQYPLSDISRKIVDKLHEDYNFTSF